MYIRKRNKKTETVTYELCQKIIHDNVNNIKCIPDFIEEEIKNYIEKDISILKHQLIYDLKRIFNTDDQKVLTDIHLKYWHNRGYTEKESLENVKLSQRKRSKRCKEYWIKQGYNETEAIEKVSEHQSNSTKNYIKSLNEDEEIEFKRKNSVWCNEFWIEKKGYSEEEAIKKVSEYQSKNTENIDYSKILRAHNTKYWTDRGYTETETRNIIKEKYNTTSLQSYINRYGPIEGPILYEDRLTKFKYTVNNWSDDKRREINNRRSEKMKNYMKNKPYQRQSKMGKKVCAKFYKKLLKNKLIENKKQFICYANGEKYLKDENKRYFYDICIDEKYIVEFNGTPWHYDSFYENELSWFWDKGHYFPEITKENVEIKDKNKKECAIRHNYKYFVIWDFQDIDEEIEKIIEVIKNDRKNNYL